MKNINKKTAVAVLLTLILLLSAIPFAVFAENSEEDLPLTLTVTPPAEPQCGVPLSFTYNASGGYGNYLFRVYKFNVVINGVETGEWDISRNINGYSSNSQFTYTFMASGTYRFRFQVMSRKLDENGSFAAAVFQNFDLEFVIDDPEYPSVETVAKSISDQAKSLYPNDQFNQVLYCHDHIINNATYDNSLLYIAETGVLCRGTGTCESYHRALTHLLKNLGIPCERAVGNGHVWSCVKIDGKWTQIDPTWNDDTSGGSAANVLRHLYFGLTDEIIVRAHSEHTPNPARPCDSLEMNYFIRTADQPSGEIHEYSDPIVSSIEENLANGSRRFDVTVNHIIPRMIDTFYPVVEYYLNEYVYKDTGVSVEYSYSIDYSKMSYIGTFSVTMGLTPVVTEEYPLSEIASHASADTSSVVISVDGVEYTADNTGNFGSITLANGSSMLVTASIYNDLGAADIHSVYPTQMKVYNLTRSNNVYTAVNLDAFDDIFSYAGCSIRTTGVKGIRMITGIPTEVKAALTSGGLEGYTLKEYGTLVAWDDEMDGKSLIYNVDPTKGNFAYKKGVADPVFANVGNYVQYTNVLVGFSLDQCADDLIMRPYMILKDSSGKETVIYGGSVQRSIGYIAYQNRNAFTPGTESYNYIWEMIHHVYGDSYDADYRE